MEFEQQGHGIVATIRSATSSEQFDLAGYTESRTHDVLAGAFAKPLDAPTEMIKFTFIVGGGKLVRSRYPDELPKWVTNALREIGYSEDRSAALDLSSQGTFKHQHDTGQNLKVIIVFPQLTCGQAKTASLPASSSTPGVDVNSKEYLLTSAELDTFKEIVNHKVESWTLKKRVLKILLDSRTRFEELEQKLVQGVLLTPDEQLIYDSNPTCDQDKINWLQGEIKEMVDKGRLTQVEKTQLLESLKANIDTIDGEIDAAQSEQKLKKVEKLEERKLNMQSRRGTVEAISPVSFPLKFASEIHSLICRLQPLLLLEEKGRSMSLTLADLKTLEEKSDIERRLVEYEQASRCWFETDEEFALRCAREREVGKSKYASSKKKTQSKSLQSKAGNSNLRSGTEGKISASSASSWNTIGKKKPTPKATQKGSGPTSGFAAAFGADSSDDES